MTHKIQQGHATVITSGLRLSVLSVPAIATLSCNCRSEEHAANDAYPPPKPDAYLNLKPYYWMDFASVLPPLLLAPQPGSAVLDMCAAPGGKSLILAQQLFKPAVELPTFAADSVHAETSSKAASSGSNQAHGDHLEQQQQQQADQAVQQQQPQQQGQQHVHQQIQQATGDTQAASCVQQQEAPAAQPAEGAPDSSMPLHISTIAAQAPGALAAAATQDDTTCAAAPTTPAPAPGRLVCNELDPQRRHRLGTVLQEYLPATCRKHVKVSSLEAVHMACSTPCGEQLR